MLEDLITSGPVRVCYCKEGKVDCNYTYLTLNVKRGETFKVEVAAVDQVNHTVDASILIKSTHHLGMEQRFQKIHNRCSNLTLTVFSPNDSVELIIYAKDPCHNFGISKKMLHINFAPCTCPIGFQQQLSKGEDYIC